MSTTYASGTPITLRQALILVVLVPLVFLGLLELVCSGLHTDRLVTGQQKDMLLEMPTWMMRDKNGAARATRVKGKTETIDWLNLFVEGDGFRVHLIPGIEHSITNTFSQIPQDRDQPYFVKANTLGFRGPELSPQKASGTFRILVFGDSSSFGWGVNQDEMFSALLPELLKRELHTTVEVGNFAIPGDSSEYGRLIAERYLPLYEADLIIIGFGANDAKRTLYGHQSQVDLFREKALLQRARSFLRMSTLYRTLEALLTTSASEGKEAVPAKPRPAVPRSRYVKNLGAMAKLAKQEGSLSVLLLNLCTPRSYAESARDYAENHNLLYFNGQQHLLSLLPAIKAGAIYPELVNEMQSLYPGSLAKNDVYYVSSDSCHPNKLGHRIIADKLSETILASSLINRLP